MKKQAGHHTQEPRKKTNEEIKQDRMARAAAKKTEEARTKAENEKNSSWDALNALYSECNELLRQPATIAPILRNKGIMEQIDDIDDFVKRANILQKDLVSYRDKLATIHETHVNNVGLVEGFDQLMQSYEVSVGYQNWMDSFTGVVLSNHFDIMDSIEKATIKATEKRNEVASEEPKSE